MRKFGNWMGALTVAVGMVAFIVVRVQADSRDERGSEHSGNVTSSEFLSLSFSCFVIEGNAGITLFFYGSGDLTGGSGSISLRNNVAAISCGGPAAVMHEAIAGLSCVNGPIRGNETGASFTSVCQTPRTALVDAMGEIGRSLLSLSVTP